MGHRTYAGVIAYLVLRGEVHFVLAATTPPVPRSPVHTVTSTAHLALPLRCRAHSDERLVYVMRDHLRRGDVMVQEAQLEHVLRFPWSHNHFYSTSLDLTTHPYAAIQSECVT